MSEDDYEEDVEEEYTVLDVGTHNTKDHTKLTSELSA